MSENLEPREQRMVDLCIRLEALDDYRAAYCHCPGDDFVVSALGKLPLGTVGIFDDAEFTVKVYKYSPQHEQLFYVRMPVSIELLDDEHINLSWLVELISRHVASAEEAGP